MFIGYLKNRAGQYHTRIYMEDEEASLALLFTYMAAVPELVVTDDLDAITAQAVGGAITFPDFCAPAEGYYRERYPARALPTFAGAAGRDEFVRREAEALGEMRDCPEKHQRMVDLLALAARDGLNLYQYGYRQADVYFGRGQEAAA